MGDFNIDLPKRNIIAVTSRLSFLTNFVALGYSPPINKPTRQTKSTATLIDNIFSNNIIKTVHLSGTLSGHLPVFTITGHELHKYPKKTPPDDYTARKITNKSLGFFSGKLQSCDWQSTLSKSDPTESNSAFSTEFFEPY